MCWFFGRDSAKLGKHILPSRIYIAEWDFKTWRAVFSKIYFRLSALPFGELNASAPLKSRFA
jgi:hypothetical protein